MDKGPALYGVGAKAPQDHQRMPTINITKPPLETDALQVAKRPTMPTKTITVTATGRAPNGDGAKEPQDDR